MGCCKKIFMHCLDDIKYNSGVIASFVCKSVVAENLLGDMTSFDVTWGSKPATGKAFVRKRKKTESLDDGTPKKSFKLSDAKSGKQGKINLVRKEIKTAESENTKGAKKSFGMKPSGTESKKTFIDSNLNENVSQTLIKRKQKKDKQAAKLNTAEPEQITSKKNESHSLFNVFHKNVRVKTNPRGKSVVEQVFSDSQKFGDLEIHKYIMSNLAKIGFTTLTNVQEKSIPVVLKGDNVLIRSQTGSGKTLAYAVPILDALQSITPRLQRSDGVQAIIIVPTRELAMQTHELFGKINTFQWIVVGHLCGGENRNTEKNRLRKGVHILIATPGRLLDHMLHTNAFKTDNVRCLVLDEADQLLDMGFKKDIMRIVQEIDSKHTSYNPMNLLKSSHKKFGEETENIEDETEIASTETQPLRDPKSKKRQTILLSATLTKGIAELADFTMKGHTYIDASDEFTSNFSHDVMIIPNTVQQKFVITHVKHRLFTLSAMLLSLTKKCSKMFVFMGTSAMVDFHYELFTNFLAKMPVNRGKMKSGDVLVLEGMEDESDDEEEILDVEFFKLHGSMEHSARKEVFKGFREVKKGILLCTDVVARGIDVPTADCIVQYNGPLKIEDYLHRVGRTGRAGKSGFSYIFLTHEEQDFVAMMEEHKVYLKQEDADSHLTELSVVMEEEDTQKAAIALQKHYENAISNSKDLHKMACVAYCSWSRFYNTFSSKLRKIFDFKQVNLGHYVTSFGLKETPTHVAKIVRGQVAKTEPQKLNRKLATHEDEEKKQRQPQKKKVKSVSLSTSEFSSGLPFKKKRKKKLDI
ncbi:unnamed protein product [Acanthoscelides obtectus]|uniref:ATP-dependent RNA helicase n=2 Tax=Acanthoscelides obtectus TaxID=200917 RepID=A0A9P0PKC5_ACAOB|nr:unnamed protein product [Acanthoscelides obtectus]CAK1676864.1 Probable ATP-dependent RNA helicase CG8611 [Acanthoscelides obtectus]